MFIPIEIRTSILQMAIREVSLMKPRHQYHLSQRGDCVYDAQSWNETRLLCESMFIPIEIRTSTLKMAIKEVSLTKPNCQYHLSQRGECVYDAQSLDETRLLYESMFIPIERCTSILKLVIGEVFFMKPKHQYY